MMKRLLWTVGVLADYYRIYWQSLMAYRGDFWTFIATAMLSQSLGVLFLWAIFAKIPTLDGWTFPQMLFIWGLAQLSLNLFYGLFNGLFAVGEHEIVEGKLDQKLTKPFSPYLQILMQGVDPKNVGDVAVALAVLFGAWRTLGVPFDLWHLALLAVDVASGVGMYAGLVTAGVSLNFWFQDRSNFLWPLMTAADFARYPVDLYGRWIRLFVSWVVPYAFVAFYPASVFLGARRYWTYAALTPLVAGAFVALGAFAWQRGIRAYESSGT